MIGQALGRYRVLEKIGAGGMGEVYRARDERLERDVALKVLPQGLLADEAARKRFHKEALSLSRLNHPNIATVHDFDTHRGVDFLVMEYVPGDTLDQKVAKGPLRERESVRLCMQLAEGLTAAHEQGVLHRDLKPGNLRVTPDGRLKILDFGLAKLVRPDASSEAAETRSLSESHAGITGTLPYMAPEQLRGEASDARTDIYAVGAVLYELATGRRAFRETLAPRLIDAILHQPPEAPRALNRQVSAGLETIALKALDKDANRRYQTARDLRADLERLSVGAPVAFATEHQPSIAVLPFANMSPDKENEYFSDGLAEEIINVLAHVPGMKVAGRTSSFFFRGKDVEFGEIGRRLNVEHILEGSLRKAGNRIRVTAQLIKVTDGFHLWSERFDREMTDIFAIQDEITQAIAGALRIRLSPEAAAPRRHEPNLRAYEAYLKARDLWYKPTGPESLARVKESLDHAIELDPKFGLAYSLLGGHYTLLANLGIRPAREVIPLARAAEQEALRVEPSLPEAHALLGVCAGMDYDWHEAERQWRLAMAREPVSRDVRFWYGNHYLLPIGRPAQAVEAEARVLEEDPLNLFYRTLFAVALQHAGRLEDAEAELRKVQDIDENFPLALGTLGAVCAQQGRLEEALTLTERAHALMPWANPIIGQLAALLVRAGATRRADALIERLRSGKEYGASTGLAVFHAMCGEFDQAAEWAERAIEERYPLFVRMLGPLLRSSPRWTALAKLMNLPG